MKPVLELWREIEGEEGTIRIHIDAEMIGLSTALGCLSLSHGDFARIAAALDSYRQAAARLSL